MNLDEITRRLMMYSAFFAFHVCEVGVAFMGRDLCFQKVRGESGQC